MSTALWIPTILVMILGSRSVSSWAGGINFHPGLGNETTGSPLDEIFYGAIMISSLFVTIVRGVKWGKFLKSNIPLMALYAFFAVSILWSGDPLGSTKRLVKDFGLLLTIAVILTEKDPHQAIRVVYLRCACILIPLSIVFDRYFPIIGRQYTVNGTPMSTGVTVQKNTLGEIVLVFCTILLWDYLEKLGRTRAFSLRRVPWDQLVLFAMGLYLLSESRSKTALLSLIICVALSVRKGWLASKLASVVAFLAALASPFLLFSTQEFGDVIRPIVEALGRNMTFTGRTNIWAQINIDTVNPFIGSGYWNFWGGPGGLSIAAAMNTPIPNAHCGYLDIYLDGGVCGLAVLFCFLLAYGLRRIKHSQEGLFQMVQFSFLVMVMVYNLAESSFARIGLLWFTTLLLIVDFPKVARSRRNRQESAEGIDTNINQIDPEVARWSVVR
jgi:O-antigen ligase